MRNMFATPRLDKPNRLAFTRPVVLVIEDDLNDSLLMRRALKGADLIYRFQWLHEGSEAVRDLSGEGRYSDRLAYPLPQILILDLKLPGMHGFELLGWLRCQPRFEKLEVILSFPDQDPAILKRAKNLGVTKFAIKTPDFRELVQLIQNHRFW
jgi:CheY-like chemotaxis protein